MCQRESPNEAMRKLDDRSILTKLSNFLGKYLEQQQDSERIKEIEKERKRRI